ncbi:hypothetical protein FQN55_004650 [Onygenales sp. PD_40]|nr:hypothetical protein FQN55_004650 [Onygenales sp. PD_40]
MRPLSLLLPLLAATGLVAARSPQHVGKKMPSLEAMTSRRLVERTPKPPPNNGYPTHPGEEHGFLNKKTRKFAVDGTKIPEVDFDVGESYAGLLPISDKKDEDGQLYFWFFPSTATDVPAEEIPVIIWLNGGPGCSSLEGFLQENGPFLWQYGTFKPVKNPWTWIKLAHMVWVEQPVGTGFTQGTPTATSEEDVAEQFAGFFKNFVDTFDLQGKELYITGESYAGYYVPYISDNFISQNDTDYYNFKGMMIYDPSLASDMIQEQIPAVAFVDYWNHLLGLNSTFLSEIHTLADTCNYTSYLTTNLAYPPPGPFPSEPVLTEDCDLFNKIFNAILLVNPCADIYQVATTCPVLWDVLGYPGSFEYLPAGASVYFNRTDVQRAINAPIQPWSECSAGDVFVNGTDTSLPSSYAVLPRVIDASQNVIIAHGLLDYVLLADGSLLAIQNMTWGGLQGFQEEPRGEFYVPYHEEQVDKGTLAGAGVMGRTGRERGLTYVDVVLSGHMVPQYAPSAALRMVEVLLGRVEGLSSREGFTVGVGE